MLKAPFLSPFSSFILPVEFMSRMFLSSLRTNKVFVSNSLQVQAILSGGPSPIHLLNLTLFFSSFDSISFKVPCLIPYHFTFYCCHHRYYHRCPFHDYYYRRHLPQHYCFRSLYPRADLHHWQRHRVRGAVPQRTPSPIPSDARCVGIVLAFHAPALGLREQRRRAGCFSKDAFAPSIARENPSHDFMMWQFEIIASLCFQN